MHEYPVTSEISYNDISDHFPAFNFYSMERNKRGKYTTVYRQKASSENINKWNRKLQNLNWEEVYTENDPCSAYGTFLNIIESRIQECLPLKKMINVVKHTKVIGYQKEFWYLADKNN